MLIIKEQFIENLIEEDKVFQSKIIIIGIGVVGMVCVICILLKVSDQFVLWLKIM